MIVARDSPSESLEGRGTDAPSAMVPDPAVHGKPDGPGPPSLVRGGEATAKPRGARYDG